MTEKPVFVVSDLHLGAGPSSTERTFRDFLRHTERAASSLVINGDLFDFWFEYRTVVPRQHFRVLAALADLTDAGVHVLFIGGNHDAWGGEFLREEVGIEVVNGPVERHLAGRRALVAHGDGLGGGDWGYRALRTVIRSRAAVASFRWLHPDVGAIAARWASSTEHRVEENERGNPARAESLERWGREQLAVNPHLDLVLTGHAHIPTFVEVANGRFYVNTGDWIWHNTYLIVPRGEEDPRLERWSAERAVSG